MSVAVLLAVPSVPASGASAPAFSASPKISASDASNELLAATASLQSGGGPLGSGSLSCSPTLFLIESCVSSIARSLSPILPASSADPGWTKLGAASPQGRLFGSMAYDSADGYVVLFGGLNVSSQIGAPLSDTWKFSGGVWTEIKPATSPSPRILQAMAYDGADRYIVLFGGFAPAVGSQGVKSLNDTWKFSSGSWTNITGTKGPSPRAATSMAYDALPTDGYVVLFGGLPVFPNGQPISTTFGDTWKFSSGTWTNITTVTGPSARAGGSMAYDTLDGYTLLYGGVSQTGVLSDGWKFSGGSWTSILSSGNPGPRVLGSIAYDSAAGDNYLVLFGGASAIVGGGLANVRSDTWKFSGGSWTNITNTVGPHAQYSAVMTYDSSQGDSYLLLFGADSASWKFSVGSWTQLTFNIPGPSPRMWPSMTYDAADGYVVLIGGQFNQGTTVVYLNDTWKFQAGVWTNITSTSGTPGNSVGPYPMAYDAADGYLVLFNGGTWKFQGGVWTSISTTCSNTTCPINRYHSSMTYDAADQRIVLFGGFNATIPTNQGLSETWEYHAGIWTKLVTSVAPSGRELPSMAYDATDGYVVLFGGDNNNNPNGPAGYRIFGDTWKFVGGSWTNITTTNGPSRRTVSMMSYDAADGYILLFGGNDFATGSSGDTWKFSAGTWTNVPTSVSPPPRDTTSMTYDGADHYVVLFGGLSNGVFLSDTWTWTLAIGTTPTYTQLRCYPGVIAEGQVQTCIMAVSGAGASVPTGTVSLTITGATGTFTPSPCPLTLISTFDFCSATFTATTTGTATITAHYDGDSVYATSSATVQITVANLHPTSINVTCNPTTIVANQPITCRATVTDTSSTGSTTPTGTVSLPVDSPTGNPVTCALSGIGPTSTCTGTGTIQFAQPAPGTSFSQVTYYDGDTGHDGSTSTVQFTWSQQRPTTTSLFCFPNTVAVGQSVWCLMGVSDSGGAGATTPTGTVNFSVTGATGTFSPSSCTLTGGITPPTTATCNFNDPLLLDLFAATTSGSATLTASYGGDSTHATSSGTATLTVANLHPTRIVVVCNPAVIVIGQSTTCTAYVNDTSTTVVTPPTGQVSLPVFTFPPGGIGSLRCTLSPVNATWSSCSGVGTRAGSCPFPCPKPSWYDGDATHDGSLMDISTGPGLTVNRRATTTTVTCTPAAITTIETSSCSATVSDSSPGTPSTPQGTVGWTSSIGTLAASCTLDATGSCSVTFSSTTTGSATITASYGGDGQHATSSNTATVTVTGLSQTMTLVTCTPSPVTLSAASTCRVVVVNPTPVNPTGTVTVVTSGPGTISGSPCTLLPVAASNGAKSACEVTITPSGTQPRTDTITATYSGDGTHSGSSGMFSLQVVLLDYTLSVAPTSQSIVTGSTAIFTITATLTAGTGQPVALLLSFSPQPNVCNPVSGVSPCGSIMLSPTALTPTIQGATSTLTITTTLIVPPGSYTFTITGSPAGASSSSATFTLTIVAPSVQTVGCGHGETCKVLSNATLSNVKLAGNTIHIEADGPHGAHGYANVTIPKSEIPNIDELHVFVDNNKLASSGVTITSNSTAYFIYFTFTFHSPVLIDIQLRTPQPANASTILGLDPMLFYEIIGALVAVVVVVSAVLMLRRRRRTSPTN